MKDVSHQLNVITYNLLYKVSKKEEYIKKVASNLESYGIFDIGGFQEVTHQTKDLLLAEMDRLKLYKIIKSKVGGTSIITILNPSIKINAICWNSFETVRRDKKTGKIEKDADGKIKMNRWRPFQIFVCEHLGFDLLIINCHFPHINKKDLDTVIVKKLTQNLTFGVKIDDSFPGGNPVNKDGSIDIQLDNSFKKQNITDLIVGKKFKVIMLGDFNDDDFAGKLNLYQGFRPFQTGYSNFLKTQDKEHQKLLNNIELGGSKDPKVPKPPPSCCLRYNEKKDTFSGNFKDFGDYTIVDSSIKIVEDNYVVPSVISSHNLRKHASDHLPVGIKVNLSDKKKSSSPKNSQGKTKKKFICKLEKFKISKSKSKKSNNK